MSIFIKENHPLAPYTIYKIGGFARFFTEAKNRDELIEAIQFAAKKGAPFFILGGGSNVLISDNGFDGLVIRMTGGEIKVSGEHLMVDAGIVMARAVMESAKAGLTGFEWGIGIPGTVGGSIRGNAGCFGGEIKDIIESVDVFDATTGAIQIFDKNTCKFSYRYSLFKENPAWVVISSDLLLKKTDPKIVQENISRISIERIHKQDIGTKSCGCIFKNIEWNEVKDKAKLVDLFPEIKQFLDRPNIPASFLIDNANLKGRRVGKIVVSPKHANFFVNEGGGSAEEVSGLISLVKSAVLQKYGLELHEEIQYVGFNK